MIEKSESITKLTQAFLRASSEFPNITKDSENPLFKSKYAALPDILSVVLPILNKNGLIILQMPVGEYGLNSMLIHESGEYISATYIMPLTDASPQNQGSAITYQRRYALAGLLSLIIDEDDDANSISNNHPAPVQQPQINQATENPPESKKEETYFTLKNFQKKLNKGGEVYWLLFTEDGRMILAGSTFTEFHNGQDYRAKIEVSTYNNRPSYYLIKILN